MNNIEVILRNTDKQVPDEALTELSLINNSTRRSTLGGQFGDRQGRLSAIQEINSTGSLLSDFSYSRSEDDLDESVTKQGRGWTDFIREKVTTDEPAAKKRRSLKDKVVEINATDTVRATTTLTVSKDGPITATSIIESLPTENVATPKAPLHKVHFIERLYSLCSNILVIFLTLFTLFIANLESNSAIEQIIIN